MVETMAAMAVQSVEGLVVVEPVAVAVAAMKPVALVAAVGQVAIMVVPTDLEPVVAVLVAMVVLTAVEPAVVVGVVPLLFDKPPHQRKNAMNAQVTNQPVGLCLSSHHGMPS